MTGLVSCGSLSSKISATSSGNFFKGLFCFLLGVRMNRARHDFPPSISVKHSIHSGLMDLMVQQILEGFLDLAGTPSPGSELRQRFEKLGFLVSAQIASTPYTSLTALDGLWTESVVTGYHVVNGRNRNVGMLSDLCRRPWIDQRIPDHKPPSLFSPSRSPQRYGYLEFRKMRQCRCNSTRKTPPKELHGGALYQILY